MTMALPIPPSWKALRLKNVVRCLDGRRIPLNAQERGLRQGDVPYWGANSIVDHVDEFLFNEPLVLLGEDGAPFFDTGKPVAFFVEGKVWVNNHAHVLRPIGVNPSFLKHCLNAVDYGPFIDGSTRDKLTQANMNEIPILVPPTDVQSQIAAFLDRKTVAIDALIAKKEQLLALLAEKRAAVINEAVTKGLDRNVAMKDSGVPWIGLIPADWEVMRLKYTCRLETGHTPSKTEPTYWIDDNCTIPWVSLNDTKLLSHHDIIAETSVKISLTGMANSSAYLIDAGAVVFTRDATIGLAAIMSVPMAVSQHIIAWVCGPKLLNWYLLRAIAAMRKDLDKFTFGATLKTIGMDDVNDMATPVPPLDEQERIVAWLDQQLQRLARVEERIRQQVSGLREYRQAVITAAVTGQIDVPFEPASADKHGEA